MAGVLLIVHIGVLAFWLGAMAYSLFLVQPRLARLVHGDATRIEEIHRELAHGNRWPVVGILALVWLSGIFAALAHPGGWFLAGLRTVALVAATALFWWVSWRAWPQRIFALPEELPRLQLRFRRVALAMFALAAVAAVMATFAAAG